MQSGNRIRDTRRKNKMTQKALAEKVEVAEITIRQYENGSRNPNPDMLCKIADALDVTTDYLLNRVDEPNEMKAAQENNLNIQILSNGLYNSLYKSTQAEKNDRKFKEIDEIVLQMSLLLSKLAKKCDEKGIYNAMFLSLNAPFFDHITNSFKQSIHRCINILENINYFKKDEDDNELNIDDIYLLLGEKKVDYDEEIKKMQKN